MGGRFSSGQELLLSVRLMREIIFLNYRTETTKKRGKCNNREKDEHNKNFHGLIKNKTTVGGACGGERWGGGGGVSKSQKHIRKGGGGEEETENSFSPDRRRIKSVRKWASLSQEVWQRRRRRGMVGGGGGSLGWWVGSSQYVDVGGVCMWNYSR